MFNFSAVQSILFHKNSIQHMTGYGLYVLNCDNVMITNCSYYHSALCNISGDFFKSAGGGVGIVYNTQLHNTDYTLKLKHDQVL